MLNSLRNFYEATTVFVTGHTGFKGSWLSIWLNELGANVVGYGLDPEHERDNFNVTNLQDKMVDIRGDVRNSEKLESSIVKHQPELVFHLAAQPLVRRSYEKPRVTYETNVLGSVNVLEACRSSQSVKAIVNVTSDKCYKNKEWVWGYRETDELGGKDPYSSSKACSEIVTKAYRESFFESGRDKQEALGLGTARTGNVIGGGDWAEDRLLPDCVKALEQKEPIKIRNPGAIRPWQHVLEPLGGYLVLGKRLSNEPTKYSGAWNFGPPKQSAVSVKNLVELVLDAWGGGEWMDTSTSDDLQEAKLLRLDNSKARYKLGWRPKLNLQETVDWTMTSYKAREDFYNQRKQQIRNYVDEDYDYVE